MAKRTLNKDKMYIEATDSAIEKRVIDLKVKDLTEAQAKKLVVDHQTFRMKALDKLYALWLGQGWKALGFADWAALCAAKFGYEATSALNMISFARIHYETKPLLTDGSDVMVTLETMPKYGTLHLKGMEAEQRVPILEELSRLGRVPTELDVLQAIPTERLSGGQANRIITLRRQAQDKTWTEKRDTLLDTARHAIDKLFALYMEDNENLEGYQEMIRNNFPNLARAWGIDPFANSVGTTDEDLEDEVDEGESQDNWEQAAYEEDFEEAVE